MLDDREVTKEIRKVLRGWVKDNLHLLSKPKTAMRDLTLVRALPKNISYEGGDLVFAHEDFERIFKELQYGSHRWPTLRVRDMLDDHLVKMVSICLAGL